ncbi:hypothetical protein LEP1GSC123_3773 [Leptospira borgpetersenii str. 200701203]|uniref:Uncharacterized protein n=1 Tax=Leptospira borgpetersenii str. 200701203 TaxID=1193007 RepID=M3HTJ2_LEPBO|nr:hypothetical protein LEP1GSC123_3773 [Leptospira borgpetersenii str. 200701203]
MVNKVLRYFLMVGILICILSIFFPTFKIRIKTNLPRSYNLRGFKKS